PLHDSSAPGCTAESASLQSVPSGRAKKPSPSASLADSVRCASASCGFTSTGARSTATSGPPQVPSSACAVTSTLVPHSALGKTATVTTLFGCAGSSSISDGSGSGAPGGPASTRTQPCENPFSSTETRMTGACCGQPDSASATPITSAQKGIEGRIGGGTLRRS